MEQKKEEHIDRRVVRTKQAIRDALGRLSEKEDYSKITVTALAQEADIDRKTFYLHYSSIDDVVTEAVHDEALKTVNTLKDIAIINSDSVNIADLYTALGMGLLPQLIPTKEAAQHLPVELILEATQQELITLLSSDEDSQLKNLGPLLEYAVDYIVSGSLATYRNWLLSGSEVPIDDLSEMIAKLAFTGVQGILEDNNDHDAHGADDLS